MQPCTRPAISASVSGVSTTNGYSTRQSVASVTCETRVQAVELDVVLVGERPSTLRARLRRSQMSRNSRPKSRDRAGRGAAAAPTALRASRGGSIGCRGVDAAALVDLGQAVVQRLDQLARGASGCRAGRPAGRGCGAPPRCRPAPRTACAPSGRSGARRAIRRAAATRIRPAAGSRSRDRKTTCSYTGFHAAGLARFLRAGRGYWLVRSWKSADELTRSGQSF